VHKLFITGEKEKKRSIRSLTPSQSWLVARIAAETINLLSTV
jgi:hypothetical protein